MTGEHLVEAEVIANGGDDAGVGSERDRGPAAALAIESPDQLRGQMLRIGRAAAVPERQHLTARTERAHHCLSRREDGLQIEMAHLLVQRRRLTEDAVDYLAGIVLVGHQLLRSLELVKSFPSQITKKAPHAEGATLP